MAKATVVFNHTKTTDKRQRFDAKVTEGESPVVSGSLYILKDKAGDLKTFSVDIDLPDPAPAAAPAAAEATPAPEPVK